MDVAGVVIGSIALVLSAFSALYAAAGLSREIRFRRPKILVEQASLKATLEQGCATAGPGYLDFVFRGANRDLTITGLDIAFARARDRRILVSDIDNQLQITLPARSLVQRRKNVGGGGFVIAESARRLPTEVSLGITVRTPEETFPPTAVKLVLGANGDYILGYPHAWVMDSHRRILTQQKPIGERLRRLVRFRAP